MKKKHPPKQPGMAEPKSKQASIKPPKQLKTEDVSYALDVALASVEKMGKKDN